MAQQARNLAWTLEEEGIKPMAVIHDRDKKFSARADSVFSSRRGLSLLLARPLPAQARRFDLIFEPHRLNYFQSG